MPIHCEILPRPDASPEQLQALGQAIQRWYHQEVKDEGTTRRIDNQALEDLLAGQMPQPVSFEALTASTEAQAKKHAVPIMVRGGPAYDRQAIIRSLRRAIPSELVEDVLVAGRSWQSGD